LPEHQKFRLSRRFSAAHSPSPVIVTYNNRLGQLRRFAACSPTRHLVCHLNEKLSGARE